MCFVLPENVLYARNRFSRQPVSGVHVVGVGVGEAAVGGAAGEDGGGRALAHAESKKYLQGVI